MGDFGQILGTTIVTIIGGFGAYKLLPAFFSQITTAVAGNKATDKTIETLQELVASERAGRVAAEAELREFISNWAEMKSKFDVMANKLDAATASYERSQAANAALKAQVEQLTRQVQELSHQLKQAHL